jgi:hypothetical protein
MPVDLMHYDLRLDRGLPIFVPAPEGLAEMLRGC